MIYGFAKQSRGHMRIYSEVGRGTTVKLYLPRALQDAVDLDLRPLRRRAAKAKRSSSWKTIQQFG